MIHFHLSWYLSDYVVTTYDQKPWGADFYLPSTVYSCILLYIAISSYDGDPWCNKKSVSGIVLGLMAGGVAGNMFFTAQAGAI